jgi:bis(5'-adenosyl)-triphosphatase
VPHVHFHLLPRKLRDDRFASRNDEIYPELERAEGSLPHELAQVAMFSPEQSSNEIGGRIVEPLKVDADEDRKPRTVEEMTKEAEWLKGFFVGLDSTDV